jgi:hypothetical protein
MNWITKKRHGAGWAHAAGIQDRAGGWALPFLGAPAERQRLLRDFETRHATAGAFGRNVVGLRDEPTLFYTDEDVRNYQIELLSRMGRIEETLRQAQSPRLADWMKAKVAIQTFLHEKPKPLGTATTLLSLPFAGQSPPNVWNSMLWSKGKNAEQTIETWEDIVNTMAPAYPPPGVPGGAPGGLPGGLPGGVPGGVAPWYNRLQGGPHNDPWAEARRLADEARKQAEKASGFPDWKDVQPYVIGGAALMGIMALASMAKSIRG